MPVKPNYCMQNVTIPANVNSSSLTPLDVGKLGTLAQFTCLRGLTGGAAGVPTVRCSLATSAEGYWISQGGFCFRIHCYISLSSL